jgi:hypothetical protein
VFRIILVLQYLFVYDCHLPSPFEVTIHSPLQSNISFYTAEVIKLLADICVFKIFVSLLKPERFCAFIILKKSAVEHTTRKFQGMCNASRTTFNSFCKCGMEGIGVLSSTHIITSRSSLQSICVIKVMSLKHLGESNDRMNSLWYAVKQIHVITKL